MSLMLHRTAMLRPSIGSATPSLPDAFEVDDWSISAGDEEADVTIHSLPANGGATITDIEYRLDGGSWIASGGTGSFTISGLTNDQVYDVALRAVNSVGAGPAGDTKHVTPESAEPPAPSIVDGLISFWELEEESGTRVDSHGSNDLTDNNTVTRNTGKVGNAAEFVAANSEYLEHADNADLGYSGDFSVAAWFYRASGSPQMIVAKGNNTFAQSEWLMNVTFATTHQLHATIFRAGGGFASLNRPTTILDSTWYFGVLTYTAATREMTLSLNAGTRATTTLADAPARKSQPLHVGRFGSSYWGGRIDQLGFWKRALSEAEEVWLYNSGNGRGYAEVAATGS